MSRTPPILRTSRGAVTLLTFDRPKKLNGWTMEMMDALRARLHGAARDDGTKVVVLTGTDPYYSAGVHLSGSLSLGHPATIHAGIIEHNAKLFELFLEFDKPLIIAVNGPAIGATVTSATLCDAIIASERATFSTPFARLGVTPEGCSSVLFPERMGADNAHRMLGPEGWVPTAQEALDAGLIDRVVPHEALLDEAVALGERWIAEGRQRTLPRGHTLAELKAINLAESRDLADAFLSPPFLDGQHTFLSKKGKRGPALMFWALSKSYPLWKRLLP